MTRVRRIPAALSILLLLSAGAGLLSSCSGSDQDDAAVGAAEPLEPETGMGFDSKGGGDQVREVSVVEGAASAGLAAGSGSVADADLALTSLALPSAGPNVIKTGDVTVEVEKDEFSDAMQRGRIIADKHGGYVTSTYTEGEKARTGAFVIRVPADRFEEALADLENLGKVVGESITGEDVGEEFVDLEARLRNLTAQEVVLLRLMDRAQTVEDTIRVQRELQGVQLDIERIRGRLRFLRDQTALSTISVSVREAGAEKPHEGALIKAWRQAVDAAMGVVSAVIVGAGFVLPLAVLAALGLVIGRRLFPRPREAD